MPPPVSAYIEAARLFGGVDCLDIAAAEDFYVRIFPRLPSDTKEKILAFVMKHEWPFRADGSSCAHELEFATSTCPASPRFDVIELIVEDA